MMEQLKALSIKNWLLYKRNIIRSFAEIILPVACVSFIIFIRNLAEIVQYEQQQFLKNETLTLNYYGDPFATANMDTSNILILKKFCEYKQVALAPKDNTIVNELNTALIVAGFSVKIYQTDNDIDSSVRDQNYGIVSPYICFGLSFENLGPNYKYNLRLNLTNWEIPRPQLDITTKQPMNLWIYNSTLISGLLTTLINNKILQKQTSTNNMLINKQGPIFQQKFIKDDIYYYLVNSLEFLLLLPLLIVYLGQISGMVQQKELKIRQSMSISGMSTSAYYLTWFIRYYPVYLIIHSISSGIISNIFSQVDFYILFVIFILFDLVLITQAFFIQIFATRAKIGIVIGLLFFVIQYVINYVLVNNSNPSKSMNTYLSVVPHVAFILAFKQILYAEAAKINIDFSEVINHYTITTALISFVCNIVVWSLLGIYLDQVFPNQWGAKKHPCFCWHNSKKIQNIHNSQKFTEKKIIVDYRLQGEKLKPSDIQSVQGKYRQMEKQNTTINIKNLSKTFNTETYAVKELSITIYSDQICVLLGHNGAGKTTTISMITGMIEPTSGIIQIYGTTEIQKIRSKIGVCPQHDTLYDDLTVEEHLRLFGTFRGIQGSELEQQVNKLIKDVNLEEKRHEFSKNLSGGQKRRLSVAIAFSGGAKVIILDEPTSGMDTSARRFIWEMLKNYKKNRIILLTTHFMDEADYLGDRIAIMGGGRLIAAGSNIYLKNKYGLGYNITFVKNRISALSQSIFKIVRKHISNAVILSDISAQLVIQLPIQKVNKFSALFGEIDKNKKQLGIQTYGISITTLQQVFLKIGSEKQEFQSTQILDKTRLKIEENELESISLARTTKKIAISSAQKIELEREDGPFQKFFTHFLATILKRLRVLRRDYKSFIFQLLLPICIILLGLLFMRINTVKDFQSQELTYKTYVNQSNPVYVPISAHFNNSALLTGIREQMTNTRNYLNVDTIMAETDLDFDQNFLYRKKFELETLKAGIYFSPIYIGFHNYTFVPFTTIVNTRSATSVITAQTLAAEAYINYLAPNPISITVISKPLPSTNRQLKLNNAISGFFTVTIFSIALSFKFSSILSLIVKQRLEKTKHQQIISGMNLYSYWFGNYFYDLILYLVVGIFSVSVCKLFSISGLIQDSAFIAVSLLFLLYGLSNIPFSYFFGYLFNDYGNAQGGGYFFNFVAGGILPISIMVLRWISESSNRVGRGIAWPLRLIPAFSFGEGLVNICSVSYLSIYQNNNLDLPIFSLEVTLAPIIFLAVGVFLYVFIIFFLEWFQNNQKLMRFWNSGMVIDESIDVEDSDVLQESRLAIEADPKNFQILTKNLRKVYMVDSEIKHKVAVDNLSFGIKKGQVFGLLGVNGAGKTTTFKMLAGEIVSTSGDSYFTGLKTSENLPEIRKNLGYCPQFDALIQNLTVKEQLQLYYDMKSLQKKAKQQQITQMIKQMDLQQYADKLSGTLSGGNKRKLSVAIAILGNPKVIFLDEPSTGMDPKARRFMWKVISRITSERKQSTVILTTHSMEEAEALSSRLAIMVKGNFKCIGTPQHIKSKYGKGFEIQIKIKNVKKEEIEKKRKELNLCKQYINKAQLEEILSLLKTGTKSKLQISQKGSGSYIWSQLQTRKQCSVNSIIEFDMIEKRVAHISTTLKKSLGSVEIIQQFQTFIRFKVNTKVSVGKMFCLLQQMKRQCFIGQYSIKQATVQQIFNKFAQEQGIKID